MRRSLKGKKKDLQSKKANELVIPHSPPLNLVVERNEKNYDYQNQESKYQNSSKRATTTVAAVNDSKCGSSKL